MSAFRDTFQVLKTEKEYFGAPETMTNQIDDAIFFKRDSTECILLVLQRTSYDLVFATVRTVRGYLKENKWYFKVSMDYYFEKSYFEVFRDNNFNNISKLGRYGVLSEGVIKRNKCELDDEYWFVQLKK